MSLQPKEWLVGTLTALVMGLVEVEFPFSKINPFPHTVAAPTLKGRFCWIGTQSMSFSRLLGVLLPAGHYGHSSLSLCVCVFLSFRLL